MIGAPGDALAQASEPAAAEATKAHKAREKAAAVAVIQGGHKFKPETYLVMRQSFCVVGALQKTLGRAEVEESTGDETVGDKGDEQAAVSAAEQLGIFTTRLPWATSANAGQLCT